MVDPAAAKVPTKFPIPSSVAVLNPETVIAVNVTVPASKG